MEVDTHCYVWPSDGLKQSQVRFPAYEKPYLRDPLRQGSAHGGVCGFKMMEFRSPVTSSAMVTPHAFAQPNGELPMSSPGISQSKFYFSTPAQVSPVTMNRNVETKILTSSGSFKRSRADLQDGETSLKRRRSDFFTEEAMQCVEGTDLQMDMAVEQCAQSRVTTKHSRLFLQSNNSSVNDQRQQGGGGYFGYSDVY